MSLTYLQPGKGGVEPHRGSEAEPQVGGQEAFLSEAEVTWTEL